MTPVNNNINIKTGFISRFILCVLPTLVFVSLISTISAAESFKVSYRNSPQENFIKLTRFDQIDYFNVLELNKAFDSYILFDPVNRRLSIDIYDEVMIFIVNSSFVLYQNESYNFYYKLINAQGANYLPVHFISKVLPAILPDKISYAEDTRIITAQLPVDRSFHTVVIDPGHGGKDPGAIGFSQKNHEKDVVLQVSKLIKQLVEKELDVKVLLTRNDDSFVPLQDRTAFANRNSANLFISLHCNAAPHNRSEGIEVFFLSTARTDEARAVEMMENSVVEIYEGGKDALDNYDSLSLVLMDMAQAEHLQESSYLAIKLQANLVKNTGANDRGVKQAGFYVLRGAFMPSVLVELGFINNRNEEKKLIDPAYQMKLAEAVYESIKSYIHSYEMFR